MPEEIKEVTQEKTYTEQEWKGLLSDKQQEVQNRQALQGELQKRESEFSSLKEELADIRSKLTEKEEAITGDPDDVATIATLKKSITGLKKEIADTKKGLMEMYQQDKTQDKQAEKNAKDQKSIEAAKKKYTEDKAGKGLTFDDVLEGTKRMIATNPAYKQLIASDPDPGEMIYNIGLQDPTIAKRYEAYKQEYPTGKVTSKEGLEGTTVPGGYYSQEYVKKMAKVPGWIKSHLKEIQESQKQWNKDIKK